MRKRKFLFSVFIFFILTYVPCANATSYFEADLDGHSWRDYSRNFKFGYITGFCHAVWVASQRTLIELNGGGALNESISYEAVRSFSKSMTKAVSPEGVSVERVVYEIDKIYESYPNRNIPVYAVIPLVGRYVRGELSSRDVRQELRAFRAEYSQMRSSGSRQIFIPQREVQESRKLRLHKREQSTQPEYSQTKPNQRRETPEEDTELKEPVNTYTGHEYASYTYRPTGFKIYLPEEWKIEEVEGKDHFLEVWSPRENVLDDYSEYVLVTHVKLRKESVIDLFSRYVSTLETTLKNFRITTGKNIKVDNKKAYVFSFTFSDDGRKPRDIKVKACWIYDVRNLYVINCSAEEESFSRHEKVFRTIIESISF